MFSKTDDRQVVVVIENKKRIANELNKMLEIVKRESLSNKLKSSLEEELLYYSPKVVSIEEYNELLLEEWEDRQLDEDTYGKSYESMYRYKEQLKNGKIRIW